MGKFDQLDYAVVMFSCYVSSMKIEKQTKNFPVNKRFIHRNKIKVTFSKTVMKYNLHVNWANLIHLRGHVFVNLHKITQLSCFINKNRKINRQKAFLKKKNYSDRSFYRP